VLARPEGVTAVTWDSRPSLICAGAASGLVSVAHQLGGSLGRGIRVTVFAAAGSTTLGARALFAHRVAVALTAGTAMLALIVVVTPTLRPAQSAQSALDGRRPAGRAAGRLFARDRRARAGTTYAG
jgi:hypothetical protein